MLLRLRRIAQIRRLAAVTLTIAALGVLLGGLKAGALPQSPPVPVPVPAGWKTVNYGAVQFAVPASWPVYDLAADPGRCVLLDTHAVYLGHQGVEAACPARALGRSEALQIEPLDATSAATAALADSPATVGGEPAQIDPSSATTQVFVAALPRAGVLLRVAWGQDEALAKQVIATLTVRPGAHPAATVASPSEDAPGAEAGTATPEAAPAATTVGSYHGRGFDTCAAPSLRSLVAWRASPFRALGIYIGGGNRACADGNLSAKWVTGASRLGWHLAPLYVGLQAPCVRQPHLTVLATNTATAAAQGAAAARDAAARARHFRIGRGTPIYFDMEAYNRKAPGCSRATVSFLSAWTGGLHHQGYRSGIYGSAGSTIADLVGAYRSASYQRPDTVWFAAWNGLPTLADRHLPDWAWPSHRRIAQYRGGHTERYGGVTINIDSDVIDTTLTGTGHSRTNFQPAIGINRDGRAELFAVTRRGALQHSWRCHCRSSWSSFTPLLPGITASGNPTVARNADGRLEVAVRTSHGGVVHAWQHVPGGGWGRQPFPRVHATASPLLFAWPGGRLEVVVPAGSTVLHAWQHVPGGSWSRWVVLGHVSTSQMSAAIDSDGHPQLFATTGDGLLLNDRWGRHGWSGFQRLTSASGLAGRPSAAVNQDGRLEVAARSGSDTLLHAWQCASCGGGWAWRHYPTLGADVATGNPTLIRSLSGRLTVTVSTATGEAKRLRQIEPATGHGGAWEPFGSLGGPVDADVAVRAATDRVFVAARSPGGSLLVGAWTATTWSGWHNLGGSF